jgi:hypothetical protein
MVFNIFVVMLFADDPFTVDISLQQNKIETKVRLSFYLLNQKTN